MEYQTVPANDLKPGDVLVNQGKIKSVKLTTREVTIVMYGSNTDWTALGLGSLQETSPSGTESVLGYKEQMTIEKRAVDMVDLAVHELAEFGTIPALTEDEFENLEKVRAQKKKENK